MTDNNLKFSLRYMGEETHLLLPHATSIILTQNLYDILFQYLTTPEREELLQTFIHKLETHIKTRNENPFSIALSEVEFLDAEGLEELRLLNWIKIPVQIFKVILHNPADDLEYFDQIIGLLNSLMVVNYDKKEQIIYVLTNNITRY